MDEKFRNHTLRGLDMVFSIIYVSHLTIVGWRGTWNLVDISVFPDEPVLGSLTSYFAGIFVIVGIKGTFPYFQRNLSPERKVVWFVISRGLTYILTWATICQWRGLWNILTFYYGVNWKSSLFVLVASFSLACFLRITLNSVSSPFVVDLDFRDDIFISMPRLRTKPDHYWDYLVDHCATQLLVESIITASWWAIWCLYDDLVLPHNFLYSNLTTWVGGVIGSILLLSAEGIFSALSITCANIGFGVQLAVEFFNVFLSLVFTIAFWRGWWNILEGILLPDLLIGGLVCHAVGITGLVVTGTLCTMCNTSIAIDGEDPEGIKWPLQYFNVIFSEKKRKPRDYKPPNGVHNSQMRKIEMLPHSTEICECFLTSL